MNFRSLSFFGLTLVLCFLQGCSTPESQERLDTALCWLRPSCLPSQLPKSPASTTPKASKGSSSSTKPQQAHNTSAPTPPSPSKSTISPSKPQQPQTASSQTTSSIKCLTSAETTIQASKPFAMISYIEPTTKANGRALTNLDKTTIYHDLGEGLVKYKDIPATNPSGGGKIQEKISFTLTGNTSLQVKICVTATNTHGQEG